MKKGGSKRAESPSELIGARIEDLGDWRGQSLLVQRVAFVEIDGTPDVAFEAGIEEARRKALFRAAVALNKSKARG